MIPHKLPVSFSRVCYKVPTTLYRGRTGTFAEIRPTEAPCLAGSSLALPRWSPDWWPGCPPKGIGLSLLPREAALDKIHVKKYAFVEAGEVVPPGLMLYKTAPDHWALEGACKMPLEGMTCCCIYDPQGYLLSI